MRSAVSRAAPLVNQHSRMIRPISLSALRKDKPRIKKIIPTAMFWYGINIARTQENNSKIFISVYLLFTYSGLDSNFHSDHEMNILVSSFPLQPSVYPKNYSGESWDITTCKKDCLGKEESQ